MSDKKRLAKKTYIYLHYSIILVQYSSHHKTAFELFKLILFMENKENTGELWETPQIIDLDVNENTKSGGFVPVDGGSLASS